MTWFSTSKYIYLLDFLEIQTVVKIILFSCDWSSWRRGFRVKL